MNLFSELIDCRLHCIYIYIYIYMGCNSSQNSWFGSIQQSDVTVRYVFDTGGGAIGCRNVGNISVLNHKDEPMDVT